MEDCERMQQHPKAGYSTIRIEREERRPSFVMDKAGNKFELKTGNYV